MNSEQRNTDGENYSDLDAFFTGFIQRKANSVEERLKRQLRGVTKIKFRDVPKVFILDGSGESFVVRAEDAVTFDAEIEMHSKDLELIANGRLNVQIAMLAGQIKVAGNIQLSIYFFNLL